MSEVNKVSDMNNPADYDLGAEEILQEEIAIQHLMEGYIMPNNFNTDLLEPQEISAVEQQRILNQTMKPAQWRAAPQIVGFWLGGGDAAGDELLGGGRICPE